MHVPFEGTLKHHGYAFLYMAIVKHKWFTRHQLNAAIKAHNFGASVSNMAIPGATLKGTKGMNPSGKQTLPFTAGQMMHFTINSIELIRPLMPTEALRSREWRAWLAHVTYITALMKPSFTSASLRKLNVLIMRFHSLFLAVPEYKSIWKPKNHFEAHMPLDILNFGPPRGYWCMRFEAKNQEFKRAARSSNKKDLPKMLANFWAHRSALMLLTPHRAKVEPHTAEEPLLVTNTRLELTQVAAMFDSTLMEGGTTLIRWLKRATHLGQQVSPGSWMMVDTGDHEYLLRVSSLFYVLAGENDSPLLCVHGSSYDLHGLFHTGDDGVPYCIENDLLDTSAITWQTFILEMCTLTILGSALLKGQRRFIEIP